MTGEMSGESNLAVLLASMQPVLLDAEYVFTSIESGRYGDLAELNPIAMFSEEEGMTLVLERQSAEAAGIAIEAVFKCITLTVHSSLDAVGLTAAFSAKLGEHGISANVIAGYYHDHIFVQAERATDAMAALLEFSAA